MARKQALKTVSPSSAPHEVTLIKVSDLKFDPSNPRLPVRMQDQEAEAVFDYMLRNGNIVELMVSIGEMGYSSAEPLLVVPDEKEEGKYVVVEGNRRLTALKLLLNPSLAKVKKLTVAETANRAVHKPTEVPTLVYTERNDVLEYLGYRHITGTKAWGSLQKAIYVQQLCKFQKRESTSFADALRKSADIMASDVQNVKKILIALGVYNAANDVGYWNSGLQEDELEFSLLYTAIGYANIKRFLSTDINCKLDINEQFGVENLNMDRVKDLFDWVFVKKNDGKSLVGESRKLAVLAKVVASEPGLAAFEKSGSLEEALLYTGEVEISYRKLLQASLKSLKGAQDIFSKIENSEQADIELVREIFTTSSDLGVAMRARRERSDKPSMPPF